MCRDSGGKDRYDVSLGRIKSSSESTYSVAPFKSKQASVERILKQERGSSDRQWLILLRMVVAVTDEPCGRVLQMTSDKPFVPIANGDANPGSSCVLRSPTINSSSNLAGDFAI